MKVRLNWQEKPKTKFQEFRLKWGAAHYAYILETKHGSYDCLSVGKNRVFKRLEEAKEWAFQQAKNYIEKSWRQSGSPIVEGGK